MFRCDHCIWFENEYCNPHTRWDTMEEIEECDEFKAIDNSYSEIEPEEDEEDDDW